MGLSPFPAGDGSAWPIHGFTTDSGTYSLSGIANNQIALHMEDINNNNALYICTGAWVIQGNGSTGQAIFTPSAADVSSGSLGKVSVYKVYPVVTLSTGPKAFDAQLIQVVSLP